MATILRPLSPSAPRLWTGRVLSALPVLFLLFDAAIKLVKIQPVIDSMAQLGYPDIARGLGVLELICVALYVWPRTALLGAVLITGLLGGAIASHLRIGDPWLTHTLFSLYVAAPLWLGLVLRDERVRALLVPFAGRPTR
jgi:hypothetical protein